MSVRWVHAKKSRLKPFVKSKQFMISLLTFIRFLNWSLKKITTGLAKNRHPVYITVPAVCKWNSLITNFTSTFVWLVVYNIRIIFRIAVCCIYYAICYSKSDRFDTVVLFLIWPWMLGVLIGVFIVHVNL